MGQRRPGGGLGQRGEVVRQPDQLHRVDDGRVGGQVAQPAPANANALLIVRVTTSRGWPGSSASALGVPGAGELGVRLVDDRPCRAPRAPRRSRPASSAVPVGLFGEQRKTTSGWCTRTWATRARRGQPEVRVARGRRSSGCRCRAASSGVHRVRRREAQRGAARPAERLQQLLLDLVGAVGRPDVGRRSSPCPR